MKRVNDENHFHKLVTNGAVALTPNQRLSRDLNARLDHYVLANQHAVATPTIMPLNTWLQQLARTHHNAVIISDWQAYSIWLHFAATTYNQFDSSKVAQTLYRAWQWLHAWQLPMMQDTTEETTQSFVKLAERYRDFLNQHELTCPNQVLDILIARKTPLPKTIILCSFDDLSPREMRWLAQLQDEGIECLSYEPCIEPQSICRREFSDEVSEWKAMAHFAKNALANGAKSVGCIVNRLSQVQQAVNATFTPICEPGSFECSIGKPLSTYPIMFDILNWFALQKEPQEVALIKNLILSPFIKHSEQAYLKRATACTHLTSLCKMSLTDLVELSQDHIDLFDSSLREVFITLRDIQQKLPRVASTKTWAKHFHHMLQCIGFPGERALNSAEYQTHVRSLNLIREFASLHAMMPQLTFAEACYYFKTLASHTVYQVQSPKAPIQILGLLEGAGLQFDALWVSGLSEETWPQPLSPNPFIPLHVQTQNQLPQASIERETRYARQLTTRYSMSAKTIIFSHCKQDGDRVINASHLISHLPLVTLDAQTDDTTYEITLEHYTDDLAPPLLNDECVRGGSALIKLQALCPFRAFATLRLAATSSGTEALGLTPAERGDVLHAALESLWRKFKTQEHLKATSDEALHQAIDTACSQALTRCGFDNTTTPRLFNNELNAMRERLLAWFEVEKARPPFRVAACEKRHSLTLGKLRLNLRVDRIDTLNDGSELVIDYKTGRTRILDWLDERPTEPQLPLYALAVPGVQSIAFAEINRDTVTYRGLSGSDTGIDGVISLDDCDAAATSDWLTQTRDWQQVCEQLAQDFTNGEARVDPEPRACDYCELATLCRV